MPPEMRDEESMPRRHPKSTYANRRLGDQKIKDRPSQPLIQDDKSKQGSVTAQDDGEDVELNIDNIEAVVGQ